MKVNTSNPIWGFHDKKLPEPFSAITSKKVMAGSKYSGDIMTSSGVVGYGKGMSTLCAPLIAALNLYSDISKSTDGGAIGENGDIVYAEISQENDITEIVAYNIETGQFKACAYDSIRMQTIWYSLEKTNPSYYGDGMALFFTMMPIILADEEAAEQAELYQTLRESSHKIDGDADPMLISAGIFCDNVYRRVISDALGEASIKMDLPEGGNISQISYNGIASGEYSPKSTLIGKFKILTPENVTAPLKELIIEENEFKLELSRELSESERAQIYAPPETHIISPEEVRVCKEIKRSWNKPLDLKIGNILLEGAAGSGKTRLARVLSYRLGLPYTKITCSANMDTDALIGTILPVLDAGTMKGLEIKDQELLTALYEGDESLSVTETLEKALGLPSHLECYYNPDEAWEKMTGEKRNQVDPVDALDKATAIASMEWQRLIKLVKGKKGDKEVEYKYYPSEIVRAFKYGYLLEIQEPTMIKDAGLLTVLNSALEMDGSINLATGMVKRHPDFICVATTNRGYAGCKSLNESFRDRFQHTEKMDLPSKEVMVQRALSVAETDDVELVRSLVDAIRALDEAAEKNSIKGVAGMRSLFYCLDAINDGTPVVEALHQKVIYKMTTDEEEIEILRTAVEAESDLLLNTQKTVF